MADTEAAPAQYKQPSRKGKKAWRKNVDVTQIQSGLEDVRDQIIQGHVPVSLHIQQLILTVLQWCHL
jgi:nucleolar protein 53